MSRDTQSSPLVSVVIPTRNRLEMLAEALASVRAQTFTDYEIIVVSNGERLEMRPFSRTVAHAKNSRYFELDKGNVSAARNFGVAQAYGEWIAFLDDDDLWLPNKLERQIAEARGTGADAIIADFEVRYANGSKSIGMTRPPANRSVRDGFLLANYGGGAASGILVRKSKLVEAGLFDHRLRAAEDWDMWARLSEVAKIAYIPDVLSSYRIHAVNLTHRHTLIALGEFKVYVKNLRRAPAYMRPIIVLAMLTRPLLIPVYLKLNKTFREFLRHLYHGRTVMRPRHRWFLFRRWLRPRTRINSMLISAGLPKWFSADSERDKPPERPPESKGPPKPILDYPCDSFYRPPRSWPGGYRTGVPQVSNGNGYAL